MGKYGQIVLIVTLALLTPGIPEYLTGSSPVSLLVLDPFRFLIGLALNMGLYTMGALLIREFAVRFRKGWGSVLLLGSAYGILEEGIAVHTFFQTSGNPAGFLATYGRFIGINGVWAIGITAFHALFSIALPLMILDLAYPKWKGKSLITLRGIIVALVVLFGTVLVLNSYAGFKPSTAWYAVLAFIGIAFVYSAYKLEFNPSKNRFADLIGKHCFLAGISGFGAYALYTLILPKTGIPPILDTIVFLPLLSFSVLFFLYYAGSTNHTKEKLFFVTGMISTLIIWAEILEFSGIARGITLVSVIAILLIYRLSKISGANIP